MQARWGTHGDHATICYAPSSAQECYEVAIRAFNNAERFRQPVLILSDEVIAHMREKVLVPEKGSFEIVNRKRPTEVPEKFVPYRPDPKDDLPCMASFGDGYTWHVTGLTHNDWGFPTNNPEEIERNVCRLVSKVERFRDDIVQYETEYTDDAEVIVLAYGSVARSARRAVRDARKRDLKAGFFRPITLWPFPDKEIEKLARRVRTIIVPEMNCGQMILEVERATKGKAKIVQQSLVNGELFKPKDILKVIEEVA